MIRSPNIWSKGTAEEVIDDEFSELTDENGPFTLSSYLIEPSETRRTHSEHAAGSNLRPGKCYHVDCYTELVAFEKTEGETGFQFTEAAHRDLIFNTREDLRNRLTLILAEMESRFSQSTKQEVGAYILGQIDDPPDEEWVDFLKSRCEEELRSDWVNLVDAARRRREEDKRKQDEENRLQKKGAQQANFLKNKQERKRSPQTEQDKGADR